MNMRALDKLVGRKVTQIYLEDMGESTTITTSDGSLFVIIAGGHCCNFASIKPLDTAHLLGKVIAGIEVTYSTLISPHRSTHTFITQNTTIHVDAGDGRTEVIFDGTEYFDNMCTGEFTVEHYAGS